MRKVMIAVTVIGTLAAMTAAVIAESSKCTTQSGYRSTASARTFARACY